ncbi:MAG TPA: cupin domain-containing protein [Chitinophagaceae bacterium]|nr:cupin domain-containing protein [Chitinophagaceae bacterium]
MKNRRSFLKATSAAVMSSTLISLPQFSFANHANKNGIVKNADEGETYFVRENTPITIKVSKKTDNIDSVSICTEEIMPGNGIPIHKHLNEDETFFFHKGNGTFILDDQEFTVTEGSIAFVPRDTWHGLKNTGNELLVFTFGFSPAGFEDFFRQIGTIKGATFKTKTQEEIKLLATKYGMIYK